MPDLETRSLPLDQIAVEVRQDDGEEGPKAISWYPALFDTLSEDLGGFKERIGRRAFTQTLQEHDVRALVNHDPNQILSRTSRGTLGLHVDQRGLHAETQIPQTSYASDLLENIRNGNISGGSFAFVSTRDDWQLEDVEGVETLVRTVKEARLYDVALVTYPAYPATEGSASLRSLAEAKREELTAQAKEKTPAADLSRYKRQLRLLQLRARR